MALTNARVIAVTFWDRTETHATISKSVQLITVGAIILVMKSRDRFTARAVKDMNLPQTTRGVLT